MPFFGTIFLMLHSYRKLLRLIANIIIKNFYFGTEAAYITLYIHCKSVSKKEKKTNVNTNVGIQFTFFRRSEGIGGIQRKPHFLQNFATAFSNARRKFT